MFPKLRKARFVEIVPFLLAKCDSTYSHSRGFVLKPLREQGSMSMLMQSEDNRTFSLKLFKPKYIDVQ